MVDDNQAGVTVNQNSLEVGNAIIKILTDLELRAFYGDLGYQLVQKRYSVESVGSSLENLYVNLVSKHLQSATS
ncbi:MAG: glycosyltransferase family 4 protein [Leptolyngbyaceae cyanobacterium SM1_4_3]|nr:glycosyltransferase family 4 protein [Leptolyngbyaceae cyanobacterium SM1_4_3]